MIIDSEELYNIHFNSNKESSYFIIPFGSDNRLHSKQNKIIAVAAIDIVTEDCYIISIDHPDGLYQRSDVSYLYENCCLVWNKQLIQYNYDKTDGLIDADTAFYLMTNTTPEYSEHAIISNYKRRYSSCFLINKIIPLHKLEEIAYEIFNKYYYVLNEPLEGIEYYNNAQKVFHNIEKNGLQIDKDLFNAFYGNTQAQIGDFCYGKYNLYTSTGRPSNTFGSVNLAAINKEDGSRDCFISRYEDGVLLEVDFESYHPRIICDLVDYKVDGSIYEHLCELYYPGEPITEDLIKQSKENTFRQIYGGVDRSYLSIDLFKRIDDLTKSIYSFYKKNGYMQLPSGRELKLDKEDSTNKHKIFNYFIQALETENNVSYLDVLQTQFQNTSILPILYVYDSILFDLKREDLDKCIQIIESVIDVKKYPIKIKTGTTYGNLTTLD